jgi:hypothetical protein
MIKLREQSCDEYMNSVADRKGASRVMKCEFELHAHAYSCEHVVAKLDARDTAVDVIGNVS